MRRIVRKRPAKSIGTVASKLPIGENANALNYNNLAEESGKRFWHFLPLFPLRIFAKKFNDVAGDHLDRTLRKVENFKSALSGV